MAQFQNTCIFFKENNKSSSSSQPTVKIVTFSTAASDSNASIMNARLLQALSTDQDNSTSNNSNAGVQLTSQAMHMLQNASANQDTNKSSSNPLVKQQHASQLFRRERSLDRGSITDNYLEQLLTLSGDHHSHSHSHRATTTSSLLQAPSYSNSILYLNANSNTTMSASVSPQHQHRQHSPGSSHLSRTTLSNSHCNTTGRGGGHMRSNSSILTSAHNLSTSPPQMQAPQLQHPVIAINNSRALLAQSTNTLNQQQQQQQQRTFSVNTNDTTFIKDVQVRLMEAQRECYLLRCELDACGQKLVASMQSIKVIYYLQLIN